MDTIILDKIEFNPSTPQVYKKLRIKKGSRNAELVHDLIEQAKLIGHPKAIYTISGIDDKDEKGIVLDGYRIDSRVMRVNLSDVNRVFPYIATSGRELYEWRQTKDDLLENYFANEINQMALRTAGNTLLDHLKKTYQLGRTSSMNPGSLKDWPLSGQQILFSLLGNPEDTIGVQLLESMLMVPNQTVSGIRFVSESDFSNCELCPRDNCSHRRAPYDEDLFQRKYQSGSIKL